MSLLAEIAAARKRRVSVLKERRAWSALEGEALFAEKRRSLSEAVSRRDAIRFLCEIKRASPSAGLIRPDLDAAAMARVYARSGAAAISLVTEEEYFSGRPADLPVVRREGLPVLMKDFLVDPYQVALARSLGADAVLVIAALRDPPMLREIRAAARDLGLQVLCEVHSEKECELAVQLDTELIGVNNRNLEDFTVDLGVSERLFPLLPADRARLSESGIRGRGEVVRLERIGFDALLIGEALLRAEDPGRALRELRGEES